MLPDQVVVPCRRVLPMEYSWALHWTQQAHRWILAKGGLGSPLREWTDRKPLDMPPPDAPARLVYVDNEIFIASAPRVGEDERVRAAKFLTGHGLPLHEVQRDERVLEAIGLELNGLEMTARPRGQEAGPTPSSLGRPSSTSRFDRARFGEDRRPPHLPVHGLPRRSCAAGRRLQVHPPRR